MEVNNALLVGGTTVAALVGVMMCCGGDKKEAKSHSKAKEVKAPAKIKKEEPRVPQKAAAKSSAAVTSTRVKTEAAAKQADPPKTEKSVSFPAAPVVEESEEDFIVPVKSKKKKQQKQQQQQKGASTAPAPIPSTAPAITVGAPTAAATAPVKAPAAAPISDGWEIVGADKKKSKKSAAPPAAPSAPTNPAPSTPAPAPAAAPPVPPADAPVSFNINVENKRLGVIIGVKGATLKAIQEATGTTINTPKNINTATSGSSATGVSVVTVTGPQEGVSRAAKAVGELAKKGYCSLLAGEDFAESPLAVHTSFVPDLVGKGGACIKALQEKLKVRVNISQTPSKDNTVKVVVAGAKDDVATAKQCIVDILTVRHSSITHPNMVHVAIAVPPEKYKFIIGSKGSEIRHIENNFKVSLYIPSDIAPQDGKVLIVGEAPAVAAAERYVLKKIADKNEAEEAEGDETWQQDAADTDDGPQEEWMEQYTFREQSQQIIPPSLLAAAAPKKSDGTTAWRDAAQKW